MYNGIINFWKLLIFWQTEFERIYKLIVQNTEFEKIRKWIVQNTEFEIIYR